MKYERLHDVPSIDDPLILGGFIKILAKHYEKYYILEADKIFYNEEYDNITIWGKIYLCKEKRLIPYGLIKIKQKEYNEAIFLI